MIMQQCQNHEDEEYVPLLGNDDSVCKKSFSVWNLFYVCCFLSGQYVFVDITGSYFKKVVSVIGLILFAIQIILFTGHVTISVIIDCYRINNLSLLATDNDYNCTLSKLHWKMSTAISIGAVASFLSYTLFTVLIVMPVNNILCCSTRQTTLYRTRKAFQNGALSPFNDSNISSNLSSSEIRGFFTSYLSMYILFIFGFVFSVVYANFVYNNYSCLDNVLHITRVVFHLCCQFSAIQSCFMFSKIVYKVTNRLKKLALDMDQVNFAEQSPQIVASVNDIELKQLIQSDEERKVDRGRFYLLQKLDHDFIEQVKPTLDLLGMWFIVHFILYGLTTVLLSAFILQIIIDVLQYSLKSTHFNDLVPFATDKIKVMFILYLVFFTLVHAYLFLYPCFRAASIATARAKMIYGIFKKRWTNIPLAIQSNFVQYLMTERFAFRVPMFCGNIVFEFNWVYVTLLLAICGAYLRFT